MTDNEALAETQRRWGARGAIYDRGPGADPRYLIGEFQGPDPLGSTSHGNGGDRLGQNPITFKFWIHGRGRTWAAAVGSVKGHGSTVFLADELGVPAPAVQ